MSRLRQLFAFLFRHDWTVTGGEIGHCEAVTHMRCTQCRAETMYYTLDRQAFSKVYQMRGCPGVPPPATKEK